MSKDTDKQRKPKPKRCTECEGVIDDYCPACGKPHGAMKSSKRSVCAGKRFELK